MFIRFILAFFFFFLSSIHKNATTITFEELLYQLPIASSLLNALPEDEQQKFFNLSSSAWLAAYTHRKQSNTLQIDRSELLKHPELALWFKGLVVNWEACRYLWDEPQMAPPESFLPDCINISKLKTLTTFASTYADLTQITTRISEQTKLDVTLIKPFTALNHYAFLQDMSPVIRSSTFYANFDTTLTLLAFLRALDSEIRSQGTKEQAPYYLEALCPELHLFVREVSRKKTKHPLDDAQQTELNLLMNQFSPYLHLSYMSDLIPSLESSLALLAMANRVEVLQKLFTPDSDEAAGDDFVERLDAALNLSQFHASELEKAITIAKPYLDQITDLHRKTVLIESVMAIPEEHRERALSMVFNLRDPDTLQNNVKVLYCLPLFSTADYEAAFPLLKRLFAYHYLARYFVAHHTIILATDRFKGDNIAKLFRPLPRNQRFQKLNDLLRPHPPESTNLRGTD